jgi:hypothetical protein
LGTCERTDVPPQSCHHQIGPVRVVHRPGCLCALCLRCGALVAGWLGDDGEAETVELLGAAADVRDHLCQFHPGVDPDATRSLRACAWASHGLTATTR